MTPTALAIETAALYLRRAPFVKGRWRLVHALQPSLCRLLRPLGYHMQEITDNHGPIALPKDSRNWPPQFNALFSPQTDTV